MRVSEVFAPSSLVEALAVLRRNPDALIWAGGTEILRLLQRRRPELPPTILSLDRLSELRAIGRSDRSVDLGAALSLGELAALREGAIPETLREAIAHVGTEALRNLATLGGNILCRSRFMDAFPALACLDALAEFKSPAGSRWMAVGRLAGADRKPAIPEGELLVRIRIPLEAWDISIVRKLGYPLWPTEETAAFTCLARTGKSMLAEFRAALGGPWFLRDRETESALLGKRLPLAARDIEAAKDAWIAKFEVEGIPAFWIGRFLSAIGEAFELLGSGAAR